MTASVDDYGFIDLDSKKQELWLCLHGESYFYRSLCENRISYILSSGLLLLHLVIFSRKSGNSDFRGPHPNF